MCDTRAKSSDALAHRPGHRPSLTPWALAGALACLLPRPAEAGFIGRLIDKLRPVKAEPVQRSRKAHLIREALYDRLKPETQANYYSLVHYQGPGGGNGSGVLVGGWQGKRGKIRGLVLTNNHVVDQNHDHRAALTFADGTQVQGSRLVARNRILDYALLEVELPKKATVQPARTEYATAGLGLPVYAMGAATSMTTQPVEEFIGGGPRAHAWLKREIARTGIIDHPVISSGIVSSDQPQPVRMSNGKRAYLSWSSAAIAPGSSGGPIFNAQGHGLIGITVGGMHDAAHSFAGMSSAGLILQDLWKQYARGRVPARHQDVVGSLLGETLPPGALAR